MLSILLLFFGWDCELHSWAHTFLPTRSSKVAPGWLVGGWLYIGLVLSRSSRFLTQSIATLMNISIHENWRSCPIRILLSVLNFDRFQEPCLFLPGIGVVGGDCHPRTTLVLMRPWASGSDLHAPQHFSPRLFHMIGGNHASPFHMVTFRLVSVQSRCHPRAD